MNGGTDIFQLDPPLYPFSSALGRYLLALLQTNQLSAPGNPYNLNTPLSPTNQMWGRLAQQYALSPAPAIMGQAAGTLGRFMRPDYSGTLEAMRNPMRGFQMPEPRQYGGPVQPGGEYTVGENGPERLSIGPGGFGQVQPMTPMRPMTGVLNEMPGATGSAGTVPLLQQYRTMFGKGF